MRLNRCGEETRACSENRISSSACPSVAHLPSIALSRQTVCCATGRDTSLHQLRRRLCYFQNMSLPEDDSCHRGRLGVPKYSRPNRPCMMCHQTAQWQSVLAMSAAPSRHPLGRDQWSACRRSLYPHGDPVQRSDRSVPLRLRRVVTIRLRPVPPSCQVGRSWLNCKIVDVRQIDVVPGPVDCCVLPSSSSKAPRYPVGYGFDEPGTMITT